MREVKIQTRDIVCKGCHTCVSRQQAEPKWLKVKEVDGTGMVTKNYYICPACEKGWIGLEDIVKEDLFA